MSRYVLSMSTKTSRLTTTRGDDTRANEFVEPEGDIEIVDEKLLDELIEEGTIKDKSEESLSDYWDSKFPDYEDGYLYV